MNVKEIDISKLPADVRRTYKQLKVLHAEKKSNYGQSNYILPQANNSLHYQPKVFRNKVYELKFFKLYVCF